MLSPGAVLSERYRLTQRLAAGGMGEVWRGEDLMLHRPVAIKVMLPALRADREFVTRFRSEARMMAALRHPGIVQVYDYGETTDGDFLVMEFVEGVPLARRIEQAGRLSPAETMTIVAQVADALQVAHEAGIVHRDVKPANLLVRPGGAIVLVDFGVARNTTAAGLTGTNVVLGSANYMAPEQAEGKPIGPATDVYALGAVAYCCLTGRPPYVGDNPLQVMSQLVYGALPTLPPDVPQPVAALVLHALAKEPTQRFPSAAAMASAARSPGGRSQPPPTRPFQQAGGTGRAQAGGPPRPGQTSGRMPIPGGAPAGGYPSGAAGAPSGAYPPGGPQSGAYRPGGPQSGAYQPGNPQTSVYPGGPQSGRFPAGAAAQAGGFQAGRAQAGRPVSGAASVPQQGGSGSFGGGDFGGGGTSGRGAALAPPDSPKKRNVTVIAAAVAVVLALGGVGLAVAWPSLTGDSGDQSTGAAGPIATSSAPATEGPKKTKSPRPTKTTEAPVEEPTTEPTPTETSIKGQDPRKVCGDGFKLVDREDLQTNEGVLKGRVSLLFNEDTAESCVVTVRLTGDGKAAPMSALLQVEGQDGNRAAENSDSYVGPVIAKAEDACIHWGGSINKLTYETDRCP
ncbi:protein kinase [Actinoplanes bogorensis]|uniref:non-specific serine/threonine protein kinase n=1 Tax=Paractinoplanes bogorensis TaxID=1610840 RepID=A0ABS5YQH0_9ACTN|nr:protein kinase [Actinoplanes bogorensis]